MTDAIEDEDETGARKRALSNRQVLAFVARFWKRRPLLFGLGVSLTLVAIGFDLRCPTPRGTWSTPSPASRAAMPAPGRRWGCSSG